VICRLHIDNFERENKADFFGEIGLTQRLTYMAEVLAFHAA